MYVQYIINTPISLHSLHICLASVHILDFRSFVLDILCIHICLSEKFCVMTAKVYHSEICYDTRTRRDNKLDSFIGCLQLHYVRLFLSYATQGMDIKWIMQNSCVIHSSMRKEVLNFADDNKYNRMFPACDSTIFTTD